MRSQTENTHLAHLINSQPSDCFFPTGGLFIDPAYSVPASFVSFILSKTRLDYSNPGSVSCTHRSRRKTVRFEGLRGGGFLSVSLSIKRSEEENGEEGYVGESRQVLGQNGNGNGSSEVEAAAVYEERENETVKSVREKGSGALNMTKHLWAGAVAAMVSRFVYLFFLPPTFLNTKMVIFVRMKYLFEHDSGFFW